MRLWTHPGVLHVHWEFCGYPANQEANKKGEETIVYCFQFVSYVGFRELSELGERSLGHYKKYS